MSATLRELADQLVAGRVSLADAYEQTRNAILGTPRSSSGIGGRVLRSTREVENDIAGLASYVGGYSLGDPQKWAGTLLMLHVQLAIGDAGAALRLGKSVVQVSRGACERTAKPFAIAIADTLLHEAGPLGPEERELFGQARQSFER